MASLKDLNKAVNKTLRSNFPHYKIYAGEVKEGFQRPSFFTQIIPLRTDYENMNYQSERLVVAITCFNKNDTELENIEVHDELISAFGRALKVGNRTLVLRNIRSNNADSTLQFSFDLDFLSRLTKEDKYEMMKQLELKQIRSE